MSIATELALLANTKESLRVALGLSTSIPFSQYASHIPPYEKSGTQVTRAPDILNIPLLPTQTISGDWDEGVTYEVADNIATFTGHGYIRNITVEAI